MKQENGWRQNYRIGFSPSGLLLFLAVMLPNFLWFAIPAPNDVLRGESLTPVVDLAASVCQGIMVAALCLIVRRDVGRFRLRSRWEIGSVACAVFYYAAWAAYYCGIASGPVLLMLTLFPCAAFLLHSAGKKNWIAFVPAAAFTVLHLIYCIGNFII